MSLLFAASYPERVSGLILRDARRRGPDRQDGSEWAPPDRLRTRGDRTAVEHWGRDCSWTRSASCSRDQRAAASARGCQ